MANVAAGTEGGVSTRRIFLRLSGSVFSDAERYFCVSMVSFVVIERMARGSSLSRNSESVKVLSRLLRRSPERPRLKMEAKMKKAIGVLVLSTTENGTGPVICACRIVSAFFMSCCRSVETVSVSTSTMNGLALVVENGSDLSGMARRSSASVLLEISGMFGRLIVDRPNPAGEKRVFQK